MHENSDDQPQEPNRREKGRRFVRMIGLGAQRATAVTAIVHMI